MYRSSFTAKKKMLSFFFVFIVLANGCTMEYEEDKMSTTEDGNIDFTTYGGLQILGERRVEGEDPVVGPLDMAELGVAIFTKCYDEMISSSETQYATFCKHKDFASRTPEDECEANICTQQMFNCMGYRFMEIADGAGVFEIETEIFEYEPTMTDGEIEFDLSLNNTLSYTRQKDQRSENVLVSYRIPPQTTANRSLALKSAYTAFREGGIRGADVLGKEECFRRIINGSNGYVVSHDEDEESDESLLDFVVVGFKESESMFAEATQTLVQNESGVASGKDSKAANHILAQAEKWQGEINSYGSALKHLLGRNADPSEVPIGTLTKISDTSQKRAVRFLRAGSSENVLNFDIDDERIVHETLKILSEREGGFSEIPDAREYMLSAGFTLTDIKQARSFLRDENMSFQRITTVTGDNNTVYGLQPPQKHSPAFWIGRIAGGRRAGFVDGRSYAKTGAIQALDYFASGAEAAINSIQEGMSGVTEEHARTIAMTAIGARTLAGNRRVEACFEKDAGRNIVADIVLEGAVVDDRRSGMRGRKVVLVKGDEGYRCVTEGSIDGAPCSPLKYIIASSTNVNVGDWPRSAMSNYTQIEASVERGTKLYVMEGESEDPKQRSISGLQVVASVEALLDEGGNGRCVVIPDGGGFRGSIADMLVPDTRVPSFPNWFCGDIPLDKDFVPPLENEITENSDPYENSWAHYLKLAKSAAEEADRLGETLVNQGLVTDEISESARRKVEEQCGGVVHLPEELMEGGVCDGNFDPNCTAVKEYLDNNGSTCLPSDMGGSVERVDVSLGEKLCAFKWKKTDRYCYCPDEGGQTGEKGNCSHECPIPAKNATSHADCEQMFREEVGGQWYIQNTENGQTEQPEFFLIDSTLNVFGDKNPKQDAKCHKLRETRLFLKNNSDQDALRDKVNELLSECGWWLNPLTIRQLNGSLRFDEHIFYHYTVHLGGRPLWTTKVDKKADCPLKYPWFPEDANNPVINCAPDGGYLPNDDRIDRDITEGYAMARKAWGDRIKRRIRTLGYLTGRVNNITTSKYAPSSVDYLFDDHYPMMDLPIRRNTTHDSCPGDGCECLYYDFPPNWESPETAPCTGQMRYGCLADFRLVEGHDQHIHWFWDNFLVDWIVGVSSDEVNVGSVLWTLKAEGGSSCGVQTKEVRTAECVSHHYFLGHCLGFYWVTTSYTIEDVPLDADAYFDRMNFACQLIDQGALDCKDFDPNTLPQLQKAEDILDLESRIKCTADGVYRNASRIVIPNMPKALVDGFKKDGFNSTYPGYGGKTLDALLGIQDALQRFSESEANIRDLLYHVAGEVRSIYLRRDLFDVQERIIELQSMQNVINYASQAVSGLFSGNVFAPLSATALSYLEEDIKGLRIDASKIEEDYYLSEKMKQIATYLSQLRETTTTIGGVYRELQSKLSMLDQAQHEAMKAYADMLGLDEGLAGRVFPYNTAMRRRQNTTRIRYQQAIQRAKKLAFIARRAIEFRLGVVMNSMEKAMTLVPAPQEWADEVCEMEGFSYEIIRDKDAEDPILDAEDHYAHMYIGDYVRKLEDFVESYNMDYPFTDEVDIAVISLKDDLFGSKSQCEIESYNRVLFSGDIGEHADVGENSESLPGGWYVGGCNDDDLTCIWRARKNDADSEYCNEDFCFGESDLKYEDSPPHKAERISEMPPCTEDGDTVCGRPDGFTNTGYFYQIIPENYSGHYVLSWRSHLPTDVSFPGVPYRVDVVTVGSDSEVIAGSGPILPYDPELGEWYRRKLHFSLEELQDVEIRIYPSAESNSSEFGDMWIWGVQLERIDPWRCEDYDGNCDVVEPLPYQETGISRIIEGEYCPDLKGHGLRRNHFERLCICENDKGVCEPGMEGSDMKHCFWQTTFSLNLERIEKGELIPSHNLSLRNHNYRHEEIAVNFVGTNVKDCSNSDMQSSCHSNAFIPYTLVHSGNVQVRNHEGDNVEFLMPTARIEYGKGLASEILVTNPPNSTHNNLLQSYYKTGLRGRPLQGEYVLRIWDIPELKWGSVEDIQLVWKYRYWTRMSYGD